MYVFSFDSPTRHFVDHLYTELCIGPNCHRSISIHVPYCTYHLKRILGLAARPSLLRDAGTGLFACKHFNIDDTLCEYGGELISSNTLNARYGKHTAPYAAPITSTLYEDGALYRGVGTLINHNPGAANACLLLNQDRKRVDVVAVQSIAPDDEIYIDYGRKYRLHELGVAHHTQYVIA
jgi:SET domain